MLKFEKISAAVQLNSQWDVIADSYFQQRKFLIHTEKYNPCLQRYYLSKVGNDIVAGACVYSLILDLFTYSRFRLPLKFSIIGIPASISDPGLMGKEKYRHALLKHIFSQEKGILLCLNIQQDFYVRPSLLIRTLPNIVMEHNFPDWEAYKASLRSKYRRRLQILEKAFKDVRVERMPCSGLSRGMYKLYEQIMSKTKTKLEVLTYDYFYRLPDEFFLNTYSLNENVICWNICLEREERLVFFFGGLDYACNHKFLAYYNSLMDITKYGVNRHKSNVEYGQTAEIPKLKCGGKLIEKKMLLYHANPIMRFIFTALKPLLEYNYRPPSFHVLKND